MKNFLKVNFCFNKEEIYKNIKDYLNNNQVEYICAANANTVTVANNDEMFRTIVNNSGFNICDGSQIALFYNLFNNEKIKSYPGPDFFIDYISKKEFKSLFLGSTEEIHLGLKKNLKKFNEKIDEMPFMTLPFLDINEFDYKAIANKINNENVDLIWVSLGAPKQEIFMSKIKPFLTRGVMIGVGAAFTFYGSEKQKRAPIIFRKLKIEWLHRIVTTRSFPKRFRNQLFYMPQLLLKDLFKRLFK